MNEINNIYDLIIIGAGPAGLTAALYAYRAGLNFVVLKNLFALDSQIVNTFEIENYLGLGKISGQGLYDKFYEHIKLFDINIINEKAVSIEKEKEIIKIVKTKKNEYKTRTIIVATGATPRTLGVKGEDIFSGQGVSYCATCDGMFFKNKTVGVVGAGDTAIEDAIYLSRICQNVYVFVRRDQMKAAQVLQQEINNIKNVTIFYNTEITEMMGEKLLSKIKTKNNKTNEENIIVVSGIFVAIGVEPETKILENKVLLKDGYVVASEDCETSIGGIYACGDIRIKNLRQVITACSDGANAVTSVCRYLSYMI